MKRGLSLLSALALLAAPAGAEARPRPLPGRAVVEREVNNWYACVIYAEGCHGRRNFHRRVTSLRCERQWSREVPTPRIMCIYAGIETRRGRRPERVRHDCVYMDPTRSSWRVVAFPDAEFCEE